MSNLRMCAEEQGAFSNPPNLFTAHPEKEMCCKKNSLSRHPYV